MSHEPEWYEETPRGNDYNLVMYGSGQSEGTSIEEIDLTRAEYIALKIRLAELRGIEHDLADEETGEDDTRAAKCRALASRLAQQSGIDLDLLSNAIDALEHDRGTFTPAEDFINTMLMLYGVRDKDSGVSAFTPDRVQEHVDGFRENFDDMQRVALRFIDRYPPKAKSQESA